MRFTLAIVGVIGAIWLLGAIVDAGRQAAALRGCSAAGTDVCVMALRP
jgi:hypothetical protein